MTTFGKPWCCLQPLYYLTTKLNIFYHNAKSDESLLCSPLWWKYFRTKRIKTPKIWKRKRKISIITSSMIQKQKIWEGKTYGNDKRYINSDETFVHIPAGCKHIHIEHKKKIKNANIVWFWIKVVLSQRGRAKYRWKW